jgi:hypothetical protein
MDLMVGFPDLVCYVELKHWLIGHQRGQQWSSRQHFNAAAKQLERRASDLLRFDGDFQVVLTMLTFLSRLTMLARIAAS